MSGWPAIWINSRPVSLRPKCGVELRILKRLFTEEEAELACKVTHLPEPAERIARRANRPAEELADLLHRMSLKGLLFRMDRPKGNLYMAAQFVVGIYEYNVNNLDPEMIKDTEEYVPVLLGALTRIETQQFRTIPIGASLDGQGTVLPYEEARKLIEEQSKMVVAPCICRKESGLIGKGCGKPLETCLIFGAAAYYYEKNRIGRSITREEALDIINGSRKGGSGPAIDQLPKNHQYLPVLRRLLSGLEGPESASPTGAGGSSQLPGPGSGRGLHRLRNLSGPLPGAGTGDERGLGRGGSGPVYRLRTLCAHLRRPGHRTDPERGK